MTFNVQNYTYISKQSIYLLPRGLAFVMQNILVPDVYVFTDSCDTVRLGVIKFRTQPDC